MSTARIEKVIQEHMEAARAEGWTLLGHLCNRRDELTPPQRLSLLRAQAYTHLREEDLLLGQMAIRAGYATEDQVHRALQAQEIAYRKGGRLPSRIGEILVASRVLTPLGLGGLLALQTRLRDRQRAWRQ